MDLITTRKHFSYASLSLFIATGIAILFGVIMVLFEGGKDVVPAMGGVLPPDGLDVPYKTSQLVFLLDILFPISFGSGFAFLAVSHKVSGNSEIVKMIILILFLVVVSDFSENALVFSTLKGGDTLLVQWPLTVLKYSLLGFSAVLMSSLIKQTNLLSKLCILFLRFVFPLSVAALVSGIGGRVGSDLVGATFPLGLFLIALYARQQSLEHA